MNAYEESCTPLHLESINAPKNASQISAMEPPFGAFLDPMLHCIFNWALVYYTNTYGILYF